MLYSVAKVSELIGLSKSKIYTKLKSKELEDHITKNQGVTYIDEVGLNLIKEGLEDLNIKEIDKSLNDEVVTDKENSTIEELKHDIELLWRDNQEKNKIITDQNLRIIRLTDKLTDSLDKAHELHQNTQVLFKQILEQPQNTPLLSEQASSNNQSYDTKFAKKGLLNKLFRR